VILYELLTGTTPLEPMRFHEAAWHEILRLIKEEDPPPPSARLSGSESLPSVAAQRQEEPARLTRQVRGDLDWIAMRCLEKERSRRYETAEGLARDVENYLADEPVEACPPSAGYRLRKFVRRNRGPVLAASAMLLLLVGGMVGTTWGLIRADRARIRADRARKAEADRAEGERKANAQAQKRLEQIEKGSEILASVFTDLDPHAEDKEDKPLRAILGDRLTRAAGLLDGEGVGDPLVVAGLQVRLGKSLLGLGLATQAIPLFDKSRATRAAVQGPDQPGTLESMDLLGAGYVAARKDGQAIPLLEEALGLMKARLGADDPLTLRCMNSLAEGYFNAGELGRAVSLHEETLRLRRAKLPADHPNTLNSMNNLAVSHQAVGRAELAVPLLEETLMLRKGSLGPYHIDTLISMKNLANGYDAAGETGRVLPLLEEALELMRAKLGPDHPTTIGCLNDLAVAYHRIANNPERSLPLLEQALKLTRDKRGPDHPDALTMMNNLATAYRSTDKLDLAIPLYEEALRLRRARFGADHPDMLNCMNNLGTTYQLAKNMDKALPLLEQVLELARAKLGPDHPKTIVYMNNLAECYRDANKMDRALPLLEQALGLILARPSADYRIVLAGRYNLATAYRDAGDLDRALPLLRETATALEERKFEHRVAGRIVNTFTGLLEQLKLLDEAEAWRRKWLAVVKGSAGVDSRPYVDELGALGANLLQQGKWADAEPALRESLTVREKKDPNGWETYLTRSLLGGALSGRKNYTEAEPLLIQGYEGVRAREGQIPPPDRYRVTEAGERIVRLYEAQGRAEEAAEWRAKLAGPGEAHPRP
jgi:tetratricopeptide (TPR) repeat protein